MPRPFISIAILNWNGVKHLQTYLPSVLETQYPHFEVVIIDNASADESRNWVEGLQHDKIKWVQLDSNTGYAGGYYHGLKQVTGEVICLLNSDVAVTPNWLDAVADAFENDECLGAAQPKILADLQRTHFEYAGASGGWIDRFGFPFTRGRIFTTVEEDQGQYNDECEVFWASGACLFVRRNWYLEAGELDSDFFAHMEEIDLCWRLHRVGAKVKIIPQSTVFHLGGGTLNYGSPFKTYLNFRNSYFCLWKNLHPSERLPKVLAHLMLDAVAGLKFLIDGYPKHTWAIVRAHWAFFGKAKEMEERKKGQPIRLKNLPGTLSGSIVWQYYLAGKKTFRSLFS
jgi:GT2 family glycosyltransferase